MTDDAALRLELIPAPNRTLGPARSLAERTLASLRAQPADVLVTTRRLLVAADGSAMFATIGAAIAVAADGDEIVVKSGRYAEHLTIERSIRISGHGPRGQIVLSPPTADAPCVTITGGTPHLTGFTIDGAGFEIPDYREDATLVRITGGAPVLETLELSGGEGVSFEGGGTAGAIRSCSIHDGDASGIYVGLGAAPLIEDNEVWGNFDEIWIDGSGTDPLIRANRLHNGRVGGIWVTDGAAPRIEENEVWGNDFPGIRIEGAGTDPLVRANRVHEGQHHGIWVTDGAAPRIEENEVWGNATSGIGIEGAGTSPVITGNHIHENSRNGIFVRDGASPTIHGNTITGNAGLAIRVEDDARPIGMDLRTALDWTPAERELARAGHPQVARFLRLVAELEPSARDQIGSRIVLDERFKLAARRVVAAAAAASPAFDIEKHVAQAIAERESLATSSTALFRSALLVEGVALGIYSRLDADTWITVSSHGLGGDPIVPFVTVWSPLSGEPAEFRSTLAMEAVADMQAHMSRSMADIRKNS